MRQAVYFLFLQYNDFSDTTFISIVKSLQNSREFINISADVLVFCVSSIQRFLWSSANVNLALKDSFLDWSKYNASLEYKVKLTIYRLYN